MSFFKNHKKLLIIISSILISIVLLFFIAQLIIGNILHSKLEDSLSSRDDSRYNISIDKVKVNLFTMTLTFRGVNITPDSTLLNQLKDKNAKEEIALNIKIPDIRVMNIGLISFIKDKQVNVRNFIINKAKIVVYQSKKSGASKIKKKDASQPVFNMDSIALPGLNGVDIGKIKIKEFSVFVIDANNSDTVFYAQSLDIAIDEIELVKNESDSISLRLVVDDVNVHMKNEKFRLPGGKYTLSFGEMIFDKQEAYIIFNNLQLKPLYNLNRMANMSDYQYEILDLEIEKTEIHSFQIRDILSDSRIYLSDVEIYKMKLGIYKDQTRPFDEKRRPKLLQELLRSLNQDLFIDSLLVKDSELTFTSKRKDNKKPMVVTLGSLNVKVSNITSVFDSIVKGKALSVKLKANLQKKIPMEVNIYLPMNSVSDTFSFNGWLSGGKMKLFNPIVLPVLGIRFHDGQLDGITFNANANSEYSIGEMTMLYHDLNAEVVKNQTEETNKFLSWAAKQVIIKNNPVKEKEKRTVPMYFERVKYKGVVNFLWRTLQSGIVGTLIPTMDTKVQNEIYTTLGIDKKEVKEIEREEKRKKRKSKKK